MVTKISTSIDTRYERLKQVNNLIDKNGTYTGAYLNEIEKDFKTAIQISRNKFNKFDFGQLEVDNKDNVIIGTLYGGINGRGRWNNYFNGLSTLVSILYEYFYIEAWLIKLKNNCPSDVFYVKFGLRYIDEYDDNFYHFKIENIKDW